MRIIKRSRLSAFWKRHPQAHTPLRQWIAVARAADWKNLRDVRGAFPHADPVVVASKKHLNEALILVDELGIIDEDRLTPGQADYLLVLSNLVERYEDDHFQDETPFADGIAALEYLLHQAKMSASDLGRLLGSRQLGPLLLRRERELSKIHIVKLAAHFKVSTDLFLQPRKLVRRAS